MTYPSTAANGQPTMAPAAVAKMATGQLPRNHPPIATIVVYIAKELGRKAVDEMNMAELRTIRKRNILPELPPNCRQIALKRKR